MKDLLISQTGSSAHRNKDTEVANKKDVKENEFFIKKRALGELFDSEFDLDVNLFRGKNPHNDNSIFYPILKSFLMSNGRVREADIRTYWNDGELMVDSTSGGISLFDIKGIPVRSWEYYMLAIKAKIPYGLVITKDDYKERFKATHYTVRPHWDMSVKKFCMLLDKLALELKKV